jgi:hypothetical protein
MRRYGGGIGEETPVNLADDFEMARQHTFKHLHRPALQRPRHQGMIGIGATLLGVVRQASSQTKSYSSQQAHQFGDCQSGMGIVELDGDLVGERSKAFVQPKVLMDDIANCAGNEKILLLKAQFAASRHGVGRVENLGNCFGDDLLLDRLKVVLH